jgi:hypothetical protein
MDEKQQVLPEAKNNEITTKPELSYYEKNQETIKLKQRIKYEKNQETILKRRRELYHSKHKLLGSKKSIYYNNNKEHINELTKIRHYDYYHNSIQYKIKNNLRSLINAAIKVDYYNKDMQYLIGINYIEFKQYLASKFEPGMSWDNRKEWHIDHIIPTTQFDLTQLADVLKCYNYANLIPRWARDNLNKAAHNI